MQKVQKKTRKKTRSGQTDIANALGISTSTVSRALAGSPSIKDSVKRQVREVALQIGYPLKKMPDFEKFDRIVVLTSLTAFRDTRSSIYNSLLEGIREEAKRYGGDVSTVVTESRTPIQEEVDKTLGPKTGCIFLGINPDLETAQGLVERGVPSIISNGIDEDLLLDSISPTNYIGGSLMARYLMKSGHRKFLYMAGTDRTTLNLRYLGFKSHVEQFSKIKGAVIQSVFEKGHDHSEKNAKLFKKWITAECGDATALFCFNDGAAVWAIENIKTLGVSVPEDLSVVGFDDMPIAQIADPALTTFRIDWTYIGQQTVQFLHKRMISPNIPSVIYQIGGHLVVRKSTQSI